MRKSQFILVLGVIALIAAVTPGWCQERTPTGFFYPTGRRIVGNGNWNTCGVTYYKDTRHIGTDIRENLWAPVYAIADGVIIDRSGPDTKSGWGSGNYALAIRHTATSGDFVAVYGHIRTSLERGEVKAGQIIGTIGPYSPPHLHFGIRPGSGISGNWGRLTDKGCKNPSATNGFVAPIDWINTQTPKSVDDSAGWLYLNRETKSPFAAADQYGIYYTFHRGASNQKMYVGRFWQNEWVELPGETDDAVDMVISGDFRIFLHRGTDNGIYWAWDISGGRTSWSGWIYIGRKTSVAPSMTVWQDLLWVIHKGEHNNVMYVGYHHPSGWWSQWWELEGEVRDRPGITVYNNELWTICRGTDNHIYLNNLSRGTGWMWTDGRATQSAPSMLAYNGRLYIIHRGEQNDRIYLGSMTGTDYHNWQWSEWRELPGETKMQPGLLVTNGRLYATRVGLSGKMYILDVTP